MLRMTVKFRIYIIFSFTATFKRNMPEHNSGADSDVRDEGEGVSFGYKKAAVPE